jgi:hypothetical protein
MAYLVHPGTDDGRGRVWALWLPARPFISPVLRPRGRNGKPKPQEPRLPLNINDRTRVNWRVVARLTAYWRGEACRVARQAEIPPCRRIRVSATVRRERDIRVDERGEEERTKPLIDGLVDAGVIPDDTRDYLEHGWVKSALGTPGVLLLVEALEV